MFWQKFQRAISIYLDFVGCEPYNSCYWASCHDDVTFTRTIIEHVMDKFCIDKDSVHLSGISNGGMFSYFAGRDKYYTFIIPIFCPFLT